MVVLSSGFAWPILGEPQKVAEDHLCIPNPMGSTFPHIADEKSETRRSEGICSGYTSS